MFKALKFVLRKVFNSNNVIAPVKFLMRLLIGTDFSKSPEAKSMEYLENLWRNSVSTPPKRNFPKKIFGMSLNLFKSILLAAVGVGLQLALFMIKKIKTRKLEELEKQEEEKKR